MTFKLSRKIFLSIYSFNKCLLNTMCQLLGARAWAENKEVLLSWSQLMVQWEQTLARFFFISFTPISKVSGFQVRAHFICWASKAIVPFNRKWRNAYSPDTHYIQWRPVLFRMPTELLLREKYCSSITSYQVLLSFLNSFFTLLK